MRLGGLTGSPGTGKTTALQFFRDAGVTIVDLRTLFATFVRDKQQFSEDLSKRFPGAVSKHPDSLDSQLLMESVYSSPAEKRAFDEIVGSTFLRHFLWQLLRTWAQRPRIIVLDLPLLFESPIPTWVFNDIVTVCCSPENQLSRLTQSMKVSEDAAAKRIKAQVPMPFKCALSTAVMDNDRDAESLGLQIEELVGRWRVEKVPFYKYPDPAYIVALLAVLGFLLYIVL